MNWLYRWIHLIKDFREYCAASHTPVSFADKDARMAYKQGYMNGHSIGKSEGFNEGFQYCQHGYGGDDE